ALPRGGVPVAYEIADAIGAPLDVFLVRRLNAPGQEELAMGAVATGGVITLNEDGVGYLDISDETVEAVIAQEGRDWDRRALLYRGGRPGPDLRGRTIILVDDGLAAGSTMRDAGVAVREHRPARIILAVPVASRATCESFDAAPDCVVCVCGMVI